MSGTMKNDGPPASPFEGVHVPVTSTGQGSFQIAWKKFRKLVLQGLDIWPGIGNWVWLTGLLVHFLGVS